MKTIFSFLFFLILVCIAFGQNDWKPGYIIQLNGDTLKGLIENNDSNTNLMLCFFRADDEGGTIKFTPKDIFGYRIIEGKFFVSKDIGDEQKENFVFLEFLIEGKASIYHYSRDVYFIEKDKKLYILKNTEEAIWNEESQKDYLIRRNEFVGTLNYLLQDANIKTDIQKTDLNHRQLIKVAKKYHDIVCKDEVCIIYEKNVNLVKFNFGPYAGMFLNKVDFGGFLISEFGTGYELGLRFELENITPWIEKLSIQSAVGLEFFSTYNFPAHKSRTNYMEYNGQDIILRETPNPAYLSVPEVEIDLKTMMMKIPLTIVYSLTKGKSRPFIGIGVVNLFVLSQNEEFIYKRFYEEFEQSIPNYHLGLGAKVGYKYYLSDYRYLFAELNYEPTSTLNINQLLRFNNQLFAVNVGFLF